MGQVQFLASFKGSDLEMWQILITALVVLVFAKLLRDTAKLGRKDLTISGVPEQRQRSLRRWIAACVALIVLANLVQGYVALSRVGVLPTPDFIPKMPVASQLEDAVGGLWFLVPLLWFLIDWDRAWIMTLQAAEKQNYSPDGAAMMLKLLAVCAVAVSSYFTLLSAIGYDNRTH